jgi:hypothetical protein
MADQDRRGDTTRNEDHTWAELPFRRLFALVFEYGFIPGLIMGWATFAIGLWTNWYLLLGEQIKLALIEYWYLAGAFGLLFMGFFYVNHWLDKRKHS